MTDYKTRAMKVKAVRYDPDDDSHDLMAFMLANPCVHLACTTTPVEGGLRIHWEPTDITVPDGWYLYIDERGRYRVMKEDDFDNIFEETTGPGHGPRGDS